ncbi:MAG: HD domain-containing protein [Proteobacteria bacterium]|nr:HD domain-containing protein [Pseudomonadota bacterium]MBU1640579.1 HD domain-containing protein [Pseudomonadota bacterium]
MDQQPFDIAAYSQEMEKILGGQDDERAHLFWKAFSFAVDAHQDQRRKSGEPYVSHPCMVAMILAKELGVTDQETLAAAMLHDTVEDVPEIKMELVGELFGPKVEAIVEGCTKISHFKGNRQTFLNLVHRKLFSGSAAHLEVMLVKLADRLHNLRTMDSMPKHKRQKISDETLGVYAPMAGVLGAFGLKRQLYNLALLYKFPRQGPRIMVTIRRILRQAEKAGIVETLKKELDAAWINNEIRLKAKGLWAYYRPQEGGLVAAIENPLEIYIVVDDLQTCYRTLGILNQTFPPIPRTMRDFIANPKPTGYQSLHVRANIKGQNYLFKIRTQEMVAQAKLGIIRDWYAKRAVPSRFKKEIAEMFNIMGGDADLSYTDMIAASGKTEIYTYTPKGDRICLPRQSTVLDFAFKVHTEIGHRCIGAHVGQQDVSPAFVLRDGDRVAILTQKEPVNFDLDIQELCQSPRARAELARTFRARRRKLAQETGELIIHQELKRYGIPCSILNNPGMEDILEYFGLKTNAELFTMLGQGEIHLREIIYEIKNGLYADTETLQPPTGALNTIELDSVDPAWVKFSRCCNPLPTEKRLYGLLSERGLSVHRLECARMQELKIQREDIMEVRWDLKKTRLEKQQTLDIPAGQKRSVVFKMLATFPDDVALAKLQAYAGRPGNDKPAWEIQFTVENLDQLKKLLKKLDKQHNLIYEFVLEQ